jgi:hypothetical protein
VGERGGEAIVSTKQARASVVTPAEQAARGRAVRAEVPRSSHAGFSPADDRPDPVGLLEEQAVSRVPELVPIRYGRMLVSPFAFYRGAALVIPPHEQSAGDARRPGTADQPASR